MSRELKLGKHEKGLDAAMEKVIVAVKAAKEIPKNALVWALTHVVQPGDSITLLVVVSSQSSDSEPVLKRARPSGFLDEVKKSSSRSLHQWNKAKQLLRFNQLGIVSWI